MIKVIMMTVGPIQGNCYLVYDEETRECMVIDPGAEGARIAREIGKNDLRVKYIVNTHGHSDHMSANQEVKEATGAELLVHREDAPMLTDGNKNFSVFMGKCIDKPAPDRHLEEGDELMVGSTKFKVLHTPGHTRGGICLVGDNMCFSGDTLFEFSIGRTDLPGGSYPQLIESIKTKLLTLDDGVVVFPGHGPDTTIGRERAANPFLG